MQRDHSSALLPVSAAGEFPHGGFAAGITAQLRIGLNENLMLEG